MKRFLARQGGTFAVVDTPRAPLAWECTAGGPDPMPKWYRLCGENRHGLPLDRNGVERVNGAGRMRPEFLLGACYREAVEAGRL